jgi:hypothetical protein
MQEKDSAFRMSVESNGSSGSDVDWQKLIRGSVGSVQLQSYD